MTINGNINIINNESDNIQSITIFDNNTSLDIEYSSTLASLEAIHNGKTDAHAALFNEIKSKNETQDTQISNLSSTKADKSELPAVNNATLTITQGGTTKGTFTANASSDVTIALDGISIDWGDISGTLSEQTDLNTALESKVNKLECVQIYPVIETYINGTSYYRIYSDGWCEQGGLSMTGTQINFVKTFANTNYFVWGMLGTDVGTNSGLSINNSDKAVGSVKITKLAGGGAENLYWKAEGYLASNQYTAGTIKGVQE